MPYHITLNILGILQIVRNFYSTSPVYLSTLQKMLTCKHQVLILENGLQNDGNNIAIEMIFN